MEGLGIKNEHIYEEDNEKDNTYERNHNIWKDTSKLHEAYKICVSLYPSYLFFHILFICPKDAAIVHCLQLLESLSSVSKKTYFLNYLNTF